MDDDIQLTDEQLEEVKRRRADPERKLVPHDEVRERLKRLEKKPM